MNKLHIVVAEDDQDDLILLARAFSHAEIKSDVHYASDGEELIEWFQDYYIHMHGAEARVLLLLDLKMPRVDGFCFLEWLGKQPFRQHVLVVILSSSEASEDIKRASALGASFYVVKPADPRELVHVLERVQAFCAEAFLVNA